MQKAVVSKIRRISQNVTITSETRGSMNGLDSLIDPYLARFSACVERETRCIAFDAKPIRRELKKNDRFAAAMYLQISKALLDSLSRSMEVAANKHSGLT